MANLYFEAQLDAEQLKKELRETNKRLQQFAKNVQTQGGEIDSTFKRIGAAMAGYFSITAAKGFLDQVIRVRGEFKQLDIALQTMLGNKEKADRLMADVVEMAAKTPFSLTELGQASKQLLAFQIPAEEITDTLKRLGDIAAGVSAPVGDIIRAFGQVKAKGRLQAEEINQFTERGIPLIAELAKELGVAEKQVLEMSSKGQIGFEELNTVIKNMTNEGGQFFNLMEKQSASLTGQLSNLGDAWERMLNEIGQKNEGILYSGISGLKTIVENYETVIDILKVIVASYGAYKAAVVAAWMAQKAMAFGQIIKSLQLMTKGINSATRAQVLFNTAVKANPLGLLVAAITAVVTSLSLFNKKQKESVDVTKEITDQFGKEKQQAEALFAQLKNTNAGTEKRLKLIEEINAQYGTNLKNLKDEKEFLNQIEQARQGVIDKLKEEMILKSERVRIEQNLSKQQLLKGLIAATEAEIERLEKLGAPAAVEAARERLEGQKETLNNLKEELKRISEDTAKQLDELWGHKHGAESEDVFDIEAYKKQLNEQKNAYETYFEALRVAREEDKEAIKKHHEDLLKEGEDFEDYLIKQLEKFNDNIAAKVVIYSAAAEANLNLSKNKTATLKGYGVDSLGGVPAPNTKALKNMDEYIKKWEQAGQEMQAAFDIQRMDEFGNKLINIAYQLQDIARTVGSIDSGLGDVMNGIADAVGQAGNISKMAASGDTWGVIGAGLNGALQVTGMLINAAKERKAAEEAFYYSIRQQQHEYNLALNEQLRLQSELAENVFIKDYEGRLTSAIKSLNKANNSYLEALEKLNEGKVKLGKKDAIDWGNVGTGLAGGAATGAAIGSAVPVVGTAVGAVVGGVAGAVAGLFGGKKKKDVWGDLLTEYPKLIQDAENGQKQLNVALAQTLINQNLVNDATKKALQNAIDWVEDVEEAKEQIRDVIGELAGGIGDELREALVSAFENGTDAAEQFGESVENTLENILSQIIFQKVYGNIFDQLQNEMEASYDVGGDGSWIDDFARMFERTSNATDEFNKALEEAKKQGEKVGFNLWSGDDDTSLSGAVKGVSEETASLIAGQMNAIRINQAESLRIMNESIRYQSEIAANTRYNSHLARLENIEIILKALKSNNASDPLKAKGL